MEVRPDILEKLLCSVCGKYLSHTPIRITKNDGSVLCGLCNPPNDEPTLRNTWYEQLAEMMLFPCKNKLHGCPETFYMAELEDHEDDCIYQQHVCPVSDPGVCNWSGSRKDIITHCREQHEGNLLQEPYTIPHDISKTNNKNFLMTAFNMLFIIHCKVCIASKNIYHGVIMIGESALANQYKYEVEIRNNRKKITSGGDVAPLDCKTLEADLSLSDNIDTILNFLGNIKDIIVKIQIGRNCIECNKFTFKYWQPTNEGWYCQDCAPTRRLCQYSFEGCTYMNMYNKTRKHEMCFCPWGTRCAICKKCVQYCNTHYRNEHSDVTYEAGTSWRATVRQGIEKCFLIDAELENLFCCYIMNHWEFVLTVWAPFDTEELSNYRCMVKLTNPAADFTIRKTLELDYDTEWDWRVKIPKDEFLMYVSNDEVNIKIEMIKIETCC